MDKNVVLITGASSGIGKACAEYLHSEGYRVYGTTRKWSNVSNGKPGDDLITMLYMDVTDKESIAIAIDDVIKQYGRIDVLINNAGMGMAGAIEDSSYEEIKTQFDTNLFGALNVINEVLPHMRKNKSGLIINIGSMAGVISIPFQAAYSGSKAAIISMTDALRCEIKPYGVKACTINPGDLKTNFTFNRKLTKKSTGGTVYKERMERSIETMARDEQNGGDPICIAKAVERVIGRKNPPLMVNVGIKYKLFALLVRILPAKLREHVVIMLYAK